MFKFNKKKIFKIHYFIIFLLFLIPPTFANSKEIQKIIITGNDRISQETIILFSGVKLNFLKNNRFDAGFTVHHKFDEFSKIANTKFYQLPFAANKEIFKDYKQDKNLDIIWNITRRLLSFNPLKCNSIVTGSFIIYNGS